MDISLPKILPSDPSNKASNKRIFSSPSSNVKGSKYFVTTVLVELCNISGKKLVLEALLWSIPFL